MTKFRVVVPSGIGDFSWIWNKLSTVKDAEFEVYVPDSYPQRTKQFVDLLPNAKGMLGRHTYPDIITYGKARPHSTWAELVANHEPGDFIYLQCNEHVGEGRKLAEWLPDLAIDYHYPFKIELLGPRPGVQTIGISMASMRGIRAWNAWLPETWVEWIKMVNKDFPGVKFIFLGGDWDIDTMLEVSGLIPEGIEYIDLVGKTTVEEAVQTLNTFDYFIGFSSGLNVVREVLNKPGCTLWPRHQYELSLAWPDPQSVANRNYMGFVYDSPLRIYNRIKPKLKEIFNGGNNGKT